MSTLPEPDLSLEPAPEDMRQWVAAAMDRIVAHVSSLPEQPAGHFGVSDDELRGLVEAMPSEGVDLEELLDLVFERAVKETFNTASPGYLAYIPGGGLFHAALADLIAGAINRYVGVWIAAPLLVQLETNVLTWFADMMGYPSGARGVLTSGGSVANFTAVVVAREDRLDGDIPRGVVYVGDQTHHSVVKAAHLAGLRRENIVAIPSDPDFRIRLDALRERIREDRAAGLRPFLVVGSAGTTNTGAVDDLTGLADLCAEEDLWLHVDAAYGGFFMLTERGREALAGIERSDSVTLDPHKGLFLPYGTGALLVREGHRLRAAHATEADYMPPLQSDDAELLRMDYCDHSLELSRDFRGLRVWLPLKMHGVGPFRNNLDEKLDLARWITEELRAVSGIEIVAAPQVTVTAFRLGREGLGLAELNELNRSLLDRILARRRVWMTSTIVEGMFVIRICVLSFRTHADRMQECLEIIREAVEEV